MRSKFQMKWKRPTRALARSLLSLGHPAPLPSADPPFQRSVTFGPALSSERRFPAESPITS